MNFDNLINDAKCCGASKCDEDDDFLISPEQLQNLLTKYILADRAASGEAVGTEARITDLEDALDHIKKIAGMARVPTKRLDWIEARASMALLNEPWDKDYKPLPKNANSSRNAVRHLTAQNTKLMEALERLISLKDHKDNNGKDYFYTENVKAAWIQARAALTPQPEKEGKE